jgi:hypothetical protein
MALAEELKVPLQYIARQAELGILTSGNADCLQRIQTSADMSMQLLDSYLLGLRLSVQPCSTLRLEPVSVSAVLYDTASQLRALAQQYGVTVQLHVQGRYEPVLAHRQALQAAMVSLGYALIEALPAASNNSQAVMQLATHRTKQGIVAGVYAEFDGLTAGGLARARQLQGLARQPLVDALAGSGAGVFVADSLLDAMSSRLRVGRFNNTPGFAVTLPASEQLQLV